MRVCVCVSISRGKFYELTLYLYPESIYLLVFGNNCYEGLRRLTV